MISVPNHRPPSNGNKPYFLIFLILGVFLYPSCGGLKKATDDEEPSRPVDSLVLDEIEGKRKNQGAEEGELEYEDGEEPEVTKEVDQIELDSLDSLFAEAEKLDRPVEMIYLLPFLADRMDEEALSVSEKSQPALHFFQGVQIALDSLRKDTLSPDMNIQVYDSEANPETVYRLLSEDSVFRKADIIIGPWRSVNLEMVSTIAGARNQIVISPFSPNSSFVENNPRFLQINPSLKTHCEEITFHIREKHAPQEVVLVCREKEAEIERLSYFQEANARHDLNVDVVPFAEYIVPDTSEVYMGLDFRPYLDDSVRVFVVPSWSNKAFVYSVLRLLSSQLLPEDGPVTVYGMPQWMDFDISSFEYFEDLNVHISMPVFADRYLPQTEAFYREYYERYATFPSREAWLAYDLTLYLAGVMQKAGLDFIEPLDALDYRGLSTGFDFKAVVAEPDSTGFDPETELPPVQYFENRRLHILEFENYQFRITED